MTKYFRDVCRRGERSAVRCMTSHIMLTLAILGATACASFACWQSAEYKQQAARVAMFQAIISNMESAVVIIDARGIVQTWNPEAEAFLGWSEQELVGTSVEILIPKEHLRTFRTVFHAAVRGPHAPKGPTAVKGWLVTKAGRPISVDGTIRVVQDGEHVYCLGILDRQQEARPVILSRPAMAASPPDVSQFRKGN